MPEPKVYLRGGDSWKEVVLLCVTYLSGQSIVGFTGCRVLSCAGVMSVRLWSVRLGGLMNTRLEAQSCVKVSTPSFNPVLFV